MTDLDGWQMRIGPSLGKLAIPVLWYFLLVFVLFPMFTVFPTVLLVKELTLVAPLYFLIAYLGLWLLFAIGILPISIGKFIHRRGAVVVREHADGRWTVQQVVGGQVKRQSMLSAAQQPKLVKTLQDVMVLVAAGDQYVMTGASTKQFALLHRKLREAQFREVGSQRDVPAELQAVRMGADQHITPLKETEGEWTTDLDGWELRATSRAWNEMGPLLSFFLIVFFLFPLVTMVPYLALFDGVLPSMPGRVVYAIVWVGVAAVMLPLQFREHMRRRGEMVIREHADGRWTLQHVYQGRVQRQAKFNASQRPALVELPQRILRLEGGGEHFYISGVSDRQLVFLRARLGDAHLREIGSLDDVPNELLDVHRRQD